MIKQLLLAGAAIAVLGSQAMAADLPVRPPVNKAPPMVAPVFDWSGFYIGGQVGYAWGDATYTVAPGLGVGYDVNGIIGGGHAGFLWQTGPAVFGVEADFSGTGVEGDDGGFGGALDSTKLQWAGSVRGILGFAFAERWLAYGTGGFAFGNIDHCFDGLNAACVDKVHTGWTAGAGLKYAFTPNWIAGVEYRYTRYQEELHAVPVAAFSRNVELNTNEITARISYKFGGPISARY
jgi:outer membrane immunogenic protein